jgi:hypothetical protein
LWDTWRGGRSGEAQQAEQVAAAERRAADGAQCVPGPFLQRAAHAPRSGAEEEMQQSCDRCCGPGGWGHVNQTENEHLEGGTKWRGSASGANGGSGEKGGRWGPMCTRTLPAESRTCAEKRSRGGDAAELRPMLWPRGLGARKSDRKRTPGGGDEVERLGKRSKWRQRREGRPMGPDVYPDPSRGEPHMRREAEQRRRCSRAATNAMAPGAGATKMAKKTEYRGPTNWSWYYGAAEAETGSPPRQPRRNRSSRRGCQSDWGRWRRLDSAGGGSYHLSPNRLHYTAECPIERTRSKQWQ